MGGRGVVQGVGGFVRGKVQTQRRYMLGIFSKKCAG